MFVALAAEAQNNLSFKTEELKKVAAELKLEGLDTLKIGYTFIQKNNHQLVVRKAENGMVEHIGIQLFPEAYRQQANGAVLDFLENKMACGVGACLCCVEKTTEGNQCVCKDGPVINIKKLTWDI